MKRSISIVAVMLLIWNGHGQELKKLWEVDVLEAPESVAFYQGHYYISNVSGQPAEKNGKGFIAQVDELGNVVQLKWLEGFNAPKGLGIYGNKLYVADIDRLAVVDLDSQAIEKWYDAEGATFLNDVEITGDGAVYVTDTFGGNAIYLLKDGSLELWLKDERLDYPNGLKFRENTLFVSTWGVVTNPETFETDVPGAVLAVDPDKRSITNVSSRTGNLDGLINYGDSFITSDWISGKLLKVGLDGEVEELMALKPGTADIEYQKDKNVLLVPRMLEGKLTAYSVN